MEWLMVIVFVVITIMESKKKSEQAKKERERRIKSQGQQVYRSESGSIPAQIEKMRVPKADVSKKKPEKSQSGWLGSLTDSLTELLEEIDSAMDTEPTETVSSNSVPSSSATNDGKRHDEMKKTPEVSRKSPEILLPSKTLIEQRPDREQRETYKKVTTSVRPVTANVRPLKNAFENDEKCEHRIELNPNITYSQQKAKTVTQAAVIVQTDKEALIQGIIWSEILGKPKAHRSNEYRFRNRV